jgi:hypothetical protein
MYIHRSSAPRLGSGLIERGLPTRVLVTLMVSTPPVLAVVLLYQGMRGRTKSGTVCNYTNYTAGRRDKPPFAQEIFGRFNTRKRLRAYQQTTCPMCASTRPACCS